MTSILTRPTLVFSICNQKEFDPICCRLLILAKDIEESPDTVENIDEDEEKRDQHGHPEIKREISRFRPCFSLVVILKSLV